MSNYTENFTSVSGDVVDASELEAEFDAIATAVNSKLDADGSGTLSGDLNMGSNEIVSLADPRLSQAQDAATFGIVGIRQVQVATSTADDSTLSQSYVDSSLTDSITLLYSDSRVVAVVFAPVRCDSNGTSLADRYAFYELYRSSGTPATITTSLNGRTMAAASTNAAPSRDSLFLMGTEVPGAGTHTYKLRHKVLNAGNESFVDGSSVGAAMMMLLEVKP